MKKTTLSLRLTLGLAVLAALMLAVPALASPATQDMQAATMTVDVGLTALNVAAQVPGSKEMIATVSGSGFDPTLSAVVGEQTNFNYSANGTGVWAGKIQTGAAQTMNFISQIDKSTLTVPAATVRARGVPVNTSSVMKVDLDHSGYGYIGPSSTWAATNAVMAVNMLAASEQRNTTVMIAARANKGPDLDVSYNTVPAAATARDRGDPQFTVQVQFKVTAPIPATEWATTTGSTNSEASYGINTTTWTTSARVPAGFGRPPTISASASSFSL